MKLTFVQEKETKNTVRYKAADVETEEALDYVYVKKAALVSEFGGDRFPDVLRVTVEAE